MLETLLFLIVTVLSFLFWNWSQKRLGWFFLNPLVFSMASIICGLLIFDIDYARYMEGAKYVDYLMEPAVVLLGYPLYKQLHIIRRQWRALLCICIGAVFGLLTCTTLLARIFGLEDWVTYSLVNMHITTAIAMETSEIMGGEPALAACMVLIAGFSGCSLGLYLLHRLRFVHQQSVGMGIGSVSHALGTAVIARSSYVSSAYASTALILCAIITAIVAPIYVPFLLAL